MQVQDDKKRDAITRVAAKLFSTQPFHKVRLEDVAAEAGVGKGTLYVYFASKEDLYYSILFEGFADLVGRVQQHLAASSECAWQRLQKIVEELVAYAFQHPQLFELMRRLRLPREHKGWEEKRRALGRLITETIRFGVERGQIADAHPELTAAFIPGLVRSAMLSKPEELDQQTLIGHIMHLLRDGLTGKKEPDAN
jgi:AcrR family transcriptional regulator